MSRELRFNICGIEASHLFDINRPQLGAQEEESADSEIPAADKPNPVPRLEECVSEELKYASTHWLDHLMKVQIMDDDLKKELKFFLKEKLLFWLEVIFLCGEMYIITIFYDEFRAPSVSYL